MDKTIQQNVENVLNKSLATTQLCSHDLYMLCRAYEDQGFIPLLLERLSGQDDDVFFFAAPTCLQWLQDIAQKEDTTSLLSLICERVNHKTPRYNIEHDQIMRGKDALREHLFHLQKKDDIQAITTILLDPMIGKVYQDGDVFGYSYESVAERAIQHRFVDLFKVAYTNLKKRTSEHLFHPYNDQHLWNTAFACNNLEVMDILAKETMSTEKAHGLLKKPLLHAIVRKTSSTLLVCPPSYIGSLTEHLNIPFVFHVEGNNPEFLDFCYRAMANDKQQEMVEEFFKKGLNETQWEQYGDLGKACLRLRLREEIGTLNTSSSHKPSKKM